eukprot:963209_1
MSYCPANKIILKFHSQTIKYIKHYNVLVMNYQSTCDKIKFLLLELEQRWRQVGEVELKSLPLIGHIKGTKACEDIGGQSDVESSTWTVIYFSIMILCAVYVSMSTVNLKRIMKEPTRTNSNSVIKHLNEATYDALLLIPGIGPKTAT